jgi:hypothetical protein
MVSTLRELITRIDAPLAKHLNEEGIEFIQFSFRWMNCLLMREFTVRNVIRMWDTYAVHPIPNQTNKQSEGQKGFSEFHIYVCAALLDKYNTQILTMDFQVLHPRIKLIQGNNDVFTSITHERMDREGN